MEIDIGAAKQALDEQGFMLLHGALDADRLATVRARLVAQAETERAEGWAATYDTASQGVLNLLNKGEVFAELAECAPVVDLIGHILGVEPLLSSLTANIVGPGTKAQFLHGDQAIMPAPWPYATVANVAWILDDFTQDNGATVVVPGSHLHGEGPDYTNLPKADPVLAPAGTAMVFDGRLWHGAGENRSTQRRHAIFAYYCAPYMRQQENMFLSLDRAVVERASPRLKSLLGYSPYLGKIGIIPR
jgi:ectoine hydroxylase-related dioxygenase (phytanoyl-CoA dioxygenase family)